MSSACRALDRRRRHRCVQGLEKGVVIVVGMVAVAVLAVLVVVVVVVLVTYLFGLFGGLVCLGPEFAKSSRAAMGRGVKRRTSNNKLTSSDASLDMAAIASRC